MAKISPKSKNDQNTPKTFLKNDQNTSWNLKNDQNTHDT